MWASCPSGCKSQATVLVCGSFLLRLRGTRPGPLQLSQLGRRWLVPGLREAATSLSPSPWHLPQSVSSRLASQDRTSLDGAQPLQGSLSFTTSSHRRPVSKQPHTSVPGFGLQDEFREQAQFPAGGLEVGWGLKSWKPVSRPRLHKAPCLSSAPAPYTPLRAESQAGSSRALRTQPAPGAHVQEGSRAPPLGPFKGTTLLP